MAQCGTCGSPGGACTLKEKKDGGTSLISNATVTFMLQMDKSPSGTSLTPSDAFHSRMGLMLPSLRVSPVLIETYWMKWGFVSVWDNKFTAVLDADSFFFFLDEPVALGTG